MKLMMDAKIKFRWWIFSRTETKHWEEKLPIPDLPDIPEMPNLPAPVLQIKEVQEVVNFLDLMKKYAAEIEKPRPLAHYDDHGVTLTAVIASEEAA